MREIRKTMRNIMLLITIVGLLTGTLSPVVLSQSTTSSPSIKDVPTEKKTAVVTGYDLQYTLSFSEQDLSFEKSLGYDLVTMSNSSSLNEIGNPMLPIKHVMIALPPGMKAIAIRILSAQERPLQGTYTIFPAQQPQPVGGTLTISPIVNLKRATYASFLPYPPQLITLGAQTDLAGQGMIEITIFPLHYLPVQKS